MKKTIIFLTLSTILYANNIKELTNKMIETHNKNIHVEKKLDTPYKIKGYVERKLNLDIEDNKLYLFVRNLNDNNYVYIQFTYKPGNNISSFNKARTKIITQCNTIVNDAYYKDCK